MKNAAIFLPEFFQNNRIFEKDSKVLNRDNCNFHWYLLRERLRKEGYELNTQDIHPLEECSFVLFMDYPTSEEHILKKLKNLKINLYLLSYESPIIKPENLRKHNHKYFQKIFTWSDKWLDDKRYIKFYYPNKIPEDLNFSLLTKSKFCTLITSNKFSYDKTELYSERNKAILWFEKHHPNEFDLYGYFWENGIWKPSLTPFLNTKIFQLVKRITDRLKISESLFRTHLNSYKGIVESKRQIYIKYKFAICYENAMNVNGYITEKIFDCFFGGCVPIYLGAPDILKYIPENTFIDKNKFKTYKKLYNYLKKMDNATYMQYLKNIEDFLKSERMYYFSDENFINTIVNNILKNK